MEDDYATLLDIAVTNYFHCSPTAYSLLILEPPPLILTKFISKKTQENVSTGFTREIRLMDEEGQEKSVAPKADENNALDGDVVPQDGLEPPTYYLRNSCSTD